MFTFAVQEVPFQSPLGLNKSYGDEPNIEKGNVRSYD